MARPLRIELAGGLYHVTSRGDPARNPSFVTIRTGKTGLPFWGIPDTTQDSLPVGGQPFPRGAANPPGSLRNFTLDSSSSDSKRPGFPVAPRLDPFFAPEQVAFRYRSHRDGGEHILELQTERFIGRVLWHVPRKGQHTVRYYGLYVPNAQTKCNQAHETLGYVSGARFPGKARAHLRALRAPVMDARPAPRQNFY